MKDNKIEDIIYNSLRNGTIPDNDTIDAIRKRHEGMDAVQSDKIIQKVQKRIENEKSEMKSYLDIDMDRLSQKASDLEGMLSGEVTPNTVSSIQDYGNAIDESLSRYSHLQSDNLFRELWQDYSAVLTKKKAGIDSIRTRAVDSTKESLAELASNLPKEQPSMDDMSRLKDMKLLAQEKKDVLGRLGADTRIAESLIYGFGKAIDCAISSDISYKDNMFGEMIEKDAESYSRPKKKNRGIFKTGAALIALGLLSYGALTLGVGGIRYAGSRINAAKERSEYLALQQRSETESLREKIEASQPVSAAQTPKDIPVNTENTSPRSHLSLGALIDSAESAYSTHISKKEVPEQNSKQTPRPPKIQRTILDDIAESYSGMRYLIYVNKAQNRTGLFEIVHGKLNPKALYCWNSTDGIGGPGPKSRNGDLMTPEGIYQIRDFERLKHHKPLYGPISMQLTYPNNIDRSLGRDGGKKGNSILICGTYMDDRIDAINTGKDITNGSIVLNSNDVLKLADLIENDYTRTIVVIEGQTRIDQNYVRRFKLE
ncbi:MAG: L,D-transpeptidase family protein [Nanoarchaeota archaeon]|nr:L,D-transpeptidase family protein [Nanoarchaeota archaeon]